MLLYRSISLEVFLLLLIQQHSAQEDYGVDESEDHSDFTEDGGEYHEHPDYSKYYSVDDSAPLVASQGNTEGGFVSPAEFSGFFAPQSLAYEPSVKQPVAVPSATFIPQLQQTQPQPSFSPIQDITNYHLSAPLRDFFEESQKKQLLQQQQQKAESYVPPGPNYISHQLPPLHRIYDEVKSASADDVERIPPRPNRPKKPTKGHGDEGYTDVEDEVEKEAKDDKYYLGLLNSKPSADYLSSKSSSPDALSHPAAPGFVKPTPEGLSPYQKYSFQPTTGASALNSKYTNSLRNPASAYTPNYERITKADVAIESEPTENIPSHLKNHDCRKLSKPSSQADEMNCFVCENVETKSKYTQCSYTAEQEPEQYHNRNSEKYSAPAKEINFRFKRYTDKEDEPYYLIRERARKANDEPTIPADYNAGFRYEPEYYDESNQQLSYSEKQAEELKKDPKNCKKVEKKGMTCTICKNPETGGNYEQCSYTSEPKQKKYAYVTEKKYDSDEPEETKVSPQTEETEQSEQSSQKPESESVEDYEERVEQKSPKKRDEEENSGQSSYENEKEADSYYYPYESSRSTKKESNEDDEKYEIPSHFAESVNHDSRRKHSSDEEDPKDFDGYHSRLFPELSQQESKEEYDNADYHIPAATKQNVEEVLAEFSKKDRSTCKKSEKKGMICYLCVDKNNIQNEECMYVQESKPQSSHLAYHGVKGTKQPEEAESQPEETKENPVVTVESKRKRFFRKASSEVPALATAASEEFVTAVPFEGDKNEFKKKRSPKKYRSLKKEPEPSVETPTEFKVENEEGAYSEETKPVYSKLHGVHLPQYMVEKSEFEKEFDRSSSPL